MSEDESELTMDEIREHYSRVEGVFRALARVGEGDDAPVTNLNYDHYGWYETRDVDDPDVIDDGYPQKKRCLIPERDFQTAVENVDRSLFAVTSWKPEEEFEDWWACGRDESDTRIWKAAEEGEETDPAAMPNYEDLRGVAAWGDIDLTDDLKGDRLDLNELTQQVAEATLDAYIEEYAKLYGSRDAVYALDSIGGAYIFGAPAATLPIAEHFEGDEDALALVMEAFVNRSNEWLAEAQERVETRIEGADSVIDPDWVNNKNREFKAPLSLHGDHDAVVTPMDTDGVTYEATPYEAVDEDLIAEVEEWAANLTADTEEHRECVEALVENLWPDYADEHDDWQAALDAWVRDQYHEQALKEKRRRERRKRTEKRREELDKLDGSLKGADITPIKQDVYDAVNDIPIDSLVQSHCAEWEPTGRDGHFNPGAGLWRDSSSGTAAFVNTDKNIFIDSGVTDASGEHAKGGPAKFMALVENIIRDPSEDLTGEDWWKAVDKLRDANYDIPVHIPEKGSEKANGETYDKMPFWAVKKAAIALDLFPKDGFVAKERNGETYAGFPGAQTYNQVLEGIEDAGFDHGREYRGEYEESEEDIQDAEALDDTSDEDDSSETSETPEPPVEGEASEVDESPETTEASEPSETDGSDDAPSTEPTKPSEHDVVPPSSPLEANGGYLGYWEDDHDGNAYFDEVANFLVETLSVLRDDGEKMMELRVWPASRKEDYYEVTVPATVFNDKRTFKNNVLVGHTVTFGGGESELNDLKKMVSEQDYPILDGVHQMGLHDDEWVTPEGNLTAGGWADEPTKRYIESHTDAERAWHLTPEKEDYDEDTVAEILELLPQTRNAERFLPVIGWFYASTLRPKIMDWTGQFNFVHVTGETGAGKSASIGTLWDLFGMGDDPKSVDDTKFTLTKAMSATNSIPMWFDEYKPGDMADYELDRFQNLLRKTTRGGVETRGNADKTIDEYHLNAPVIVSGEQSIQGPAEERRAIPVRFLESVKEPGSDTHVAFAELQGMDYEGPDGTTHHPDGYDFQEHTLALLDFVLTAPDENLLDLWREARDEVGSILAREGITEIDNLPRQGLTTVKFGLNLYEMFCSAVDADPTFDEDDVRDAIVYVAERMTSKEKQKKHLDIFAEVAGRAAQAGYLEEGEHYAFVNRGEPTEELRLKLSTAFDEVSRYVRDHDLNGEDLLNRVADYRERVREAYDTDGEHYIVAKSQNTPGLSRCVGIDVDTAERMISGFERGMWTDEVEEDEGSEFSADNDGGDGNGGQGGVQIESAKPLTLTPVNVLDEKVGSRTVNVTAEVTDLEVDPEQVESMALSGTLKDSTGPVRFVAWKSDGVDYADLLEEGTAYRFKFVQVSEFDGTPQVVIDLKNTEVEEVGDGYGTLERTGNDFRLDEAADMADDANSSDETTSDTDTDGEATTADAGADASAESQATPDGGSASAAPAGGSASATSTNAGASANTSSSTETDDEETEAVDENGGETATVADSDTDEESEPEPESEADAESDDDSSGTASSDETPDKDPREVVKMVVTRYSSGSGAAHDKVVDWMTSHGYSEEAAESYIEKAEREGDIWESMEDHYRQT